MGGSWTSCLHRRLYAPCSAVPSRPLWAAHKQHHGKNALLPPWSLDVPTVHNTATAFHWSRTALQSRSVQTGLDDSHDRPRASPAGGALPFYSFANDKVSASDCHAIFRFANIKIKKNNNHLTCDISKKVAIIVTVATKFFQKCLAKLLCRTCLSILMNFYQAQKRAAPYPYEAPSVVIAPQRRKHLWTQAPRSYLHNVGRGISPVAALVLSGGKCAQFEVYIVCTKSRFFPLRCTGFEKLIVFRLAT